MGTTKLQQALVIDVVRTPVGKYCAAIALGHPLGCTGARLMATLAHELKRRKVRYGPATMCISVDQGIATVTEAVG
jgi:acetyl-CoA acetyltransferase